MTTGRQVKPEAGLTARVGLDGSDYADTFTTTAPADVAGDVQRAARRFMASTPVLARWLLTARNRAALLVDRDAERHAARASDELRQIVVGERPSMFRVYRVDAGAIVIGEDDRLMRYRIVLRLDSVNRLFTCATAVEFRRSLLARPSFVAGLSAHRWFVRSTLRRFSAS